LLNAGCPVTSIQKFLGHKRLNSTMIYARVHDQTVAADYYAAMTRIEKRLAPPAITPATGVDNVNGRVSAGQRTQLLTMVDDLQGGRLNEAQQKTVKELRTAILTLGRQEKVQEKRQVNPIDYAVFCW
jgi:hypothetical protein